MPAFVETAKDEELWRKAKQRVREQYPDVEEGSDRFYKLTTGIFKKMGGMDGVEKGIVVLRKAWAGEPVRHAEAAKEGWEKRRQGKAPDISDARAERVMRFMDRTSRHGGEIDWQDYAARAGKSAPGRMRTLLRKFGLLHGRGHDAQLNILGQVACAYPGRTVSWMKENKPVDELTAGFAVVNRIANGESLQADVMADDMNVSTEQVDGWLRAISDGTPLKYSTTAGLNQAWLDTNSQTMVQYLGALCDRFGEDVGRRQLAKSLLKKATTQVAGYPRRTPSGGITMVPPHDREIEGQPGEQDAGEQQGQQQEQQAENRRYRFANPKHASRSEDDLLEKYRKVRGDRDARLHDDTQVLMREFGGHKHRGYGIYGPDGNLAATVHTRRLPNDTGVEIAAAWTDSDWRGKRSMEPLLRSLAREHGAVYGPRDMTSDLWATVKAMNKQHETSEEAPPDRKTRRLKLQQKQQDTLFKGWIDPYTYQRSDGKIISVRGHHHPRKGSGDVSDLFAAYRQISADMSEAGDPPQGGEQSPASSDDTTAGHSLDPLDEKRVIRVLKEFDGRSRNPYGHDHGWLAPAGDIVAKPVVHQQAAEAALRAISGITYDPDDNTDANRKLAKRGFVQVQQGAGEDMIGFVVGGAVTREQLAAMSELVRDYSEAYIDIAETAEEFLGGTDIQSQQHLRRYLKEYDMLEKGLGSHMPRLVAVFGNLSKLIKGWIEPYTYERNGKTIHVSGHEHPRKGSGKPSGQMSMFGEGQQKPEEEVAGEEPDENLMETYGGAVAEAHAENVGEAISQLTGPGTQAAKDKAAQKLETLREQWNENWPEEIQEAVLEQAPFSEDAAAFLRGDLTIDNLIDPEIDAETVEDDEPRGDDSAPTADTIDRYADKYAEAHEQGDIDLREQFMERRREYEFGEYESEEAMENALAVVEEAMRRAGIEFDPVVTGEEELEAPEAEEETPEEPEGPPEIDAGEEGEGAPELPVEIDVDDEDEEDLSGLIEAIESGDIDPENMLREQREYVDLEEKKLREAIEEERLSEEQIAERREDIESVKRDMQRVVDATWEAEDRYVEPWDDESIPGEPAGEPFVEDDAGEWEALTGTDAVVAAIKNGKIDPQEEIDKLEHYIEVEQEHIDEMRDRKDNPNLQFPHRDERIAEWQEQIEHVQEAAEEAADESTEAEIEETSEEGQEGELPGDVSEEERTKELYREPEEAGVHPSVSDELPISYDESGETPNFLRRGENDYNTVASGEAEVTDVSDDGERLKLTWEDGERSAWVDETVADPLGYSAEDIVTDEGTQVDDPETYLDELTEQLSNAQVQENRAALGQVDEGEAQEERDEADAMTSAWREWAEETPEEAQRLVSENVEREDHRERLLPEGAEVAGPDEDPTFDEMVQDAAAFQYLAGQATPEDKDLWGQHTDRSNKSALDRWLMERYGLDRGDARSVSNEASHRNITGGGRWNTEAAGGMDEPSLDDYPSLQGRWDYSDEGGENDATGAEIPRESFSYLDPENEDTAVKHLASQIRDTGMSKEEALQNWRDSVSPDNPEKRAQQERIVERAADQVQEKTSADTGGSAPESSAGGTATGINGAAVTRNRERGGVEVKFDSKPPDRVLDALKENGFRWSGRQKLWYAKYSPERAAVARDAVDIEESDEGAESRAMREMARQHDMDFEDHMSRHTRSGGRPGVNDIPRDF